uniref:Uncharacterized protein n=1 Tax=Anopheles atroparvus TaxID=41427 RepID=A0A182J7X7_ANOAO
MNTIKAVRAVESEASSGPLLFERDGLVIVLMANIAFDITASVVFVIVPNALSPCRMSLIFVMMTHGASDDALWPQHSQPLRPPTKLAVAQVTSNESSQLCSSKDHYAAGSRHGTKDFNAAVNKEHLQTTKLIVLRAFLRRSWMGA